MLKEAIEKIVTIAQPTPFNVEGHNYLAGADETPGYIEVVPEIPRPAVLELSSLEAVVQMVKTEALPRYSLIHITVPTHDKVSVFLSLEGEEKRYDRVFLYEARATDVPGWEESVKLPFDQAAVALQTRFQEGGDRDYALQLLSQITTGAKVTYNDTGIATTIVTQKGVALQQNATIKPLIRLRPYRTFQEVEQPEGLFLIRIDERGITFTEADGGMWKLTARKTVAAYLADAFKQEKVGSIIVTI